MYRDIAQWSSIRNQILRKGISIRQVVRETGISRETVRKTLDHPLPQPYGPRSHRYPKLGPHTASLRRMLQENATMPPSARLSIKAIYNRIRNEEGFRGSYGSVKDYARAIDFLFLLSRADPPVISRSRTEQFFRDAGRVISITPKPDTREQARRAAFEWMRAILQKEISPNTLCREIGDVPDMAALLDCLYDGRLSDRNRSMAVLANGRGLSRSTVCGFLGINKHTYRKYLRTFAGMPGCSRVRPNPRGNTTTRRSSKRSLDYCTSHTPTTASIARPGSCATWPGFCGRRDNRPAPT